MSCHESLAINRETFGRKFWTEPGLMVFSMPHAWNSTSLPKTLSLHFYYQFNFIIHADLFPDLKSIHGNYCADVCAGLRIFSGVEFGQEPKCAIAAQGSGHKN